METKITWFYWSLRLWYQTHLTFQYHTDYLFSIIPKKERSWECHIHTLIAPQCHCLIKALLVPKLHSEMMDFPSKAKNKKLSQSQRLWDGWASFTDRNITLTAETYSPNF